MQNKFVRFKSETTNSLWILIEKSSKILIGFVLGVYFARLLGTEKFGIYNTVISYVLIFVGISAMGLNGLAVKEFVRHKNAPYVFKSVFLIRFVGVLACLALSFLTGFLFLDDTRVVQGIFLVSILILFTPSEVFGFYFESTLNSRYNSLAKSFSFILGAAIKLTLLFMGASLKSLFMAHVLEGFIAFVLLYIFFSKHGIKIASIISAPIKKAYIKSLIAQGWPLLVSSIAVILYLKIDQIMILEYLGADKAGIYGVGVRVCEAVFLIPTIIVPSLFPKIIQLHLKDKEHYIKFLAKILKWFGVLSLIITLFLFFTVDFLVPYLFGEEYQESTLVIKIYAISIIFVFWGSVLSKWLIVEKLTKLSIVRHGMGVFANVLLNIILIPKLGLMGAAIASVISYFMSTIGFLFITQEGLNFVKQLIKTT